jgi:hypothetical protein
MTRSFGRVCAIGIVASLAMVAVADGPFAAQTQVNPDAQVLVDFSDRVKAYLALRDKVDGDAPRQQATKEAGKIDEAQRALAAVIRNARVGAKQGDIFAPAIEKKLRALLSPEVKGKEGAKAKATILEEKPMVELKVNTEYPSAEPL